MEVIRGISPEQHERATDVAKSFTLVGNSGGGILTSDYVAASSAKELRLKLAAKKVRRFDIEREPGMFSESFHGDTVRSNILLSDLDDQLFAFLTENTGLQIAFSESVSISLPVEPGQEVVAMYLRGQWVPMR